MLLLLPCGLKLLDYHRLRHDEEKSWDRERLARDAGPEFLAAAEALLPLHDEPWALHKLLRFTREPWFDKCLELCELCAVATGAQRTWLRSRVDRKIGGKIGLFSLRAAILAARRHDTSLARAALIGFAIVDLVEGDVRDTLIGLSLICHCATRSGAAVPALFREVGDMAGPAMSALYKEWAARYPDVQSIGSMGWKEVDTEDGIGFRM